jgi:hypothetical protein
MESSDQLHAPAALTAPGTHCIKGWVRPRAGLDVMEKKTLFPLPGNKPHILGRPARSLVTIPTELCAY